MRKAFIIISLLTVLLVSACSSPDVDVNVSVNDTEIDTPVVDEEPKEVKETIAKDNVVKEVEEVTVGDRGQG